MTNTFYPPYHSPVQAAVITTVWLLVSGCTLPGSVKAQGPEIMDLRVGLDGKYKLGHWTPVWIELRGTDRPVMGRLEVALSDADGATARFVSDPFTLPARQRAVRPMYVQPGRNQTTWQVSFRAIETNPPADMRTRTFAVPPPLSNRNRLIVSIGSAARLDEALKQVAISDRPPVHVHLPPEHPLPTRAWGYQAVDLLVLTTGEGIWPRAIGQRQALVEWVKRGGSVLVSAARHADRLAASDEPMGHLLPGRFAGLTHIRQTTGPEGFADATTALDQLRQPEQLVFQLIISTFSDLNGRVQVREGLGSGGRPVVIQHAVGFGTVLFVAADLDAFPLIAWPDQPRFVARLLDHMLHWSAGEPQHPSAPAPTSQLGYDDLTGQLRMALDQFTGVHRVSFALAAALIAAYLVCIGPLDYWLVHRAFHCPHLTWCTLIIWVAGWCAGAWYVAWYWKGEQLRVNQLNVVDWDLKTQQVRGMHWSGVFAPQARRYDLGLEPTLFTSEPVAGSLLTGQESTGPSSGGMNRAGLASLTHQDYRIIVAGMDKAALRVQLESLPFSTWSSRSLHGQWWSLAQPAVTGAAGQPRSGLREAAYAQLTGTVRNPLPVDLLDAAVYYDRWAYVLGPRMAAGSSVALDAIRPRDVKGLLTRRRLVEMRDVSTPWERFSVDVPRIAEMIMFHQAAGGMDYTGLTHRYRSRSDLSPLLPLQRAVLVGRTDQPGARILAGNSPLAPRQTRDWTYYRIVFPVDVEG